MFRNALLLACWVLILLIIHPLGSEGQSHSISGRVYNAIHLSPMAGVSIREKNTPYGIPTDHSGYFLLQVPRTGTVTLVFSALGYLTTQRSFQVSDTQIRVLLFPRALWGRETIVVATRLPQNLLASPVSVERMGLLALSQIPGPSYYDALSYLEGVNMMSSSILFSSIQSRGFASSSNMRLNQLVDGMDEQAPGLNFPLGNFLGPSDLDIQDMELQSGPSSALYGTGGTNGTLLIRTKDPFRYTGLSAEIKEGIMRLGDPHNHASPYQGYSLRWARAFYRKWALKINASYVRASDWAAGDTRDYDRSLGAFKAGTRQSDPNYDGLNIYGDEVSANLASVAQGLASAGILSQSDLSLVPSQLVSRTGYSEQDLMDQPSYALKLGGALHYRLSPSLLLIAQGNWGTGDARYTGADRYSLKGFRLGQYKLELDGPRFYLRAYTTRENSGLAYNATALGEMINRSWKSDKQWFQDFTTAFVGDEKSGLKDAAAFTQARQAADQGRWLPGSTSFVQARKSIIGTPIPGGAGFLDRSSLWDYEGWYHFGRLILWMDLQAGASLRRYHLNSRGTLFADKNGRKLTNNEIGLFLQGSRAFMKMHIKLLAALRYDKNQNFGGRLTPRLALVYRISDNNYLRASFQTGFRNPSNQDQYTDLNLGVVRLLGGLPEFRETYNFSGNTVYTLSSYRQFSQSYQQVYSQVYSQALASGENPSQASSTAGSQALAQARILLLPYPFGAFGPETVRTWEAGYRGLLVPNLLVDAQVYWSAYSHFLTNTTLVQSEPLGGPTDTQALLNPSTTQVYAVAVNSPLRISSFGWACSATLLLPRNLRLEGNLAYNRIGPIPQGYHSFFNTPDYMANIGLQDMYLFPNLGFAIHLRWQDGYYYESNFADGYLPAFSTLDLQITLRIPSRKILLKWGGTNILNHYYLNGIGNPAIGALFYMALRYHLP